MTTGKSTPKQKRMFASVISVLVVLSLLVGATMAWFTDREQVNANFFAGTLDLELTPANPNADGAMDFQNLRPLTLAQLQSELKAAADTVVANENTDGFDPLPVYFHAVTLSNVGSLPMRVTLSLADNGACDKTIANVVENGAGGVSQADRIACAENYHLKDVLKVVVFKNAGDAETPNWQLVLDQNGNPVNLNAADASYTLSEMLAAKTSVQYVIGGWLPEGVDNAYQAQHFHAGIIAQGVQLDAGSGEVTEPTQPTDPTDPTDPTNPTDPTDPTQPTDPTDPTEPAKPDGSAENPYQIYDEATLRAVEKDMDAYYIVTKDFSITRGWEPLGLGDDTDVAFSGSIDGQGHTISGLHTVMDTYSNIGLIAINNGVIKDLNLQANQMEGSSEVGTLAGVNDANGVISNVHVTGNYVGALSKGSNGGYAGGLVGKNNGLIEFSSASILGSGVERGVVAYNYAGGLIGGNWGTVRQSYASCGINAGYVNDINAGNLQTYYAGGFAGGNVGTIENCYAIVSDYIAGVQRVGGFLGLNGASGAVKSCYVVPNDKVYGGQTETSVSIGKNTGTVSSSYVESTTSGSVNGFTRITRANLTGGSALSGFDTSVWSFQNGQYPNLVNNPR